MFDTHVGYLPAYDADLEDMSIEERNDWLDMFDIELGLFIDGRDFEDVAA